MTDFKITIKDNSITVQIGMFIMNKLLSADSNNNVLIDNNCVECDCDVYGKKDLTDTIQDIETFKIYYNMPYDKLICFKYKEHDFVSVKRQTSQIPCKNNGLTFDNLYDMDIIIKNGNTKLFTEFCNDTLNWYKNIVRDKQKTKNLTTCLYWDSWTWEVMHKQKKRNVGSLYFEDKFINNIIDIVTKFLKPETEKIYERLGIPYKKSLLFEGPPGTGKSSLICTIAAHFDLDIAYLQINEESKSNSIMKCIRKLPRNSILVFEDIDSLFDKREKIENNNTISFSTILNIIDGVIKPQDKIIIIFTTNFLKKIDPALKRPGRIDEIITFTYATKGQINKMFNNYFPEHLSVFGSFYKKIKQFKLLSICHLQQYFLKYIEQPLSLAEHTDELAIIIRQSGDLYNSQNILFS